MKELARTLLPNPIFQGLRSVYSKLKEEAVPEITPIPKTTNRSLLDRLEWFERAQAYLQANRINGVYTEFGCHEANTFRFALNTLGKYRTPNKISRFYAFDSFEGMPEPVGIDRQRIWRKGINSTSVESFERTCRKDMHRVTCVKGFFEDSLHSFNWNPTHKIACAYIDVDYYKSTVECLRFISGKLQHGSIIAFDDWNCYYADPQRGMRKAFSEWYKEIDSEVVLEPFLPISWGGMSFIYQEVDKIGTEAI
jgi:hypothetical protein